MNNKLLTKHNKLIKINENISSRKSNDNLTFSSIYKGLSTKYSRYEPSRTISEINELIEDNSNRIPYYELTQYVINNLKLEADYDNYLTNLDKLLQYCNNSNNNVSNNVIKVVRKIIDHTNLAKFQDNYICDMFQKASTEAKDNLDKNVKDVISNTEKEIKENSTSMQKDYVTILGIFSAVVLAFNGGMSLMANAFSSLAESNTFNVVLVLLVSGLVLGDVLFIMLYVIGRITDKNIFEIKESNIINESKGCFKTLKNSWFNKVRVNLPYVFYFNAILILLIIVIAIIICIFVYTGKLAFII